MKKLWFNILNVFGFGKTKHQRYLEERKKELILKQEKIDQEVAEKIIDLAFFLFDDWLYCKNNNRLFIINPCQMTIMYKIVDHDTAKYKDVIIYNLIILKFNALKQYYINKENAEE